MKPRALPRILLAAAFLLAMPWTVAAQVAVPPLKARVTDLARALDDRQRAALEQKLAAFEARKGSQIVVLLVPATRPETVEQYAIRVAEAWRPGRKGVDDGVLLLVAMQDRALRIEVGYGLEGALPDAMAKRIIEERIVPRFRQGDFHGGIEAGIDSIIKAIDGEALPPPAAARPAAFPWEEFVAFGFVLVFVAGGVLRALLGRVGGSGVIGVIAGVAAWFILGSVLVAVLVGVVLFVLSLFGGVAMPGGRRGGWLPGSSGGGWSSGGGFGGGGGGFGGGGASGRW